MSNELLIWTVYDKPLDYPTEFVARAHRIGPGVTTPTNEMVTGSTLREVRRQLEAQGLTNLGRQPGDEPQIVESWI